MFTHNYSPYFFSISLLFLFSTPVWSQGEDQATEMASDFGDFTEMVLVEGGSFEMGDAEGELAENEIHTVTLSDFYLAKHEVTQAEWEAVMGENPSRFVDCEQCPVENVSWQDAQRFLEKLNEQTGQQYRLPTEAEWEYAARGGKNRNEYRYSGSNNINEVAWYWHNAASKTHPVMQKAPNSLGLYDMSGSVMEWCEDWFAEDYYASSSEKDPQGPETGVMRVARGGGWDLDSKRSPVRHRHYYVPFSKNDALGLRLAHSVATED